MTVRPARLPRALAASALVAALAGCAGTDAPRSPATSASSSSSSSSSASSSAAGTGTPSAAPAQNSTRAELDVVAGPVPAQQDGRLSVRVGESVTLVLNSKIDDELHVHGYDLTADLRAGQTTELTFDATIPGVFEVELHDAGSVLLSLQVS